MFFAFVRDFVFWSGGVGHPSLRQFCITLLVDEHSSSCLAILRVSAPFADSADIRPNQEPSSRMPPYATSRHSRLVMAGSHQRVQRALDTAKALLAHVRVYLGGLGAAMAQEFLDVSEISP